jgi:hypothetical protein
MKASKATTRARVEDILRVLNDGATCWQMRQYVAQMEQKGESPWTIPEGGKALSERQIRRYVAAADKVIAEDNRTHRAKRRRRHVAKLQSLYARCVNKGDERTARAVLHDLAELQGLHGTDTASKAPKGAGDVDDFFARVERYIPVLRQLGAAPAAAADAPGVRDGGVPAGAVPGERLRELLAAPEADGEAGGLPVP